MRHADAQLPVAIGFASLRHFRTRLPQRQFQLARLFMCLVRPVESVPPQAAEAVGETCTHSVK